MPRRYWYVILTYIFMQVSGLIVSLALITFTPDIYTEGVIYWTLISFVLALVIILKLMKPDMAMQRDNEAIGVGGMIIWSVVGVFMALFAQGLAVVIETKIFGVPPGSENTQFIMEIARAMPIFVIVPMLLAPILEEIVFRKIIFGTLYKRMNFFFAALLSALIFGIIHGEPEHLLIYASIGFVFSFLYVKTKRILTPILVHAGMNSLAVIGQYSMTPEEIQKQLEQLQTILFIM